MKMNIQLYYLQVTTKRVHGFMLPLFSYKNWFIGSPFLSQARKKNVSIHGCSDE